jgi:orotidine-5'-phosphate decarboxylase
MLLAVTVLTSLGAGALAETGVAGGPVQQVLRLAHLADAAGIDGLVCSAAEVAPIRAALGDRLALVVPGIRPAGSALDDQARVATPASAVASGADWLVVGRPITQASDPARSAQAIAESIAA